MEAVIRLLLPHVTRWQRFELLTDTWAPIFTFLWYTRRVESAPMLRSIALSRGNTYFAAEGQGFEPATLKQPVPLFGDIALDNLREVSFAGVHVDWSKSALRNLVAFELKYHARDRGCFGHAEASVVCGDETGVVWGWDLLDVSVLIFYASTFSTTIRNSPAHSICVL